MFRRSGDDRILMGGPSEPEWVPQASVPPSADAVPEIIDEHEISIGVVGPASEEPEAACGVNPGHGPISCPRHVRWVSFAFYPIHTELEAEVATGCPGPLAGRRIVHPYIIEDGAVAGRIVAGPAEKPESAAGIAER